MEENKQGQVLDLIDLKTAAASLSISVFTLKNLLKANDTPVVRQGRSIMIKRSRLEELVNLSEKPYSQIIKSKNKKSGRKLSVKKIALKKPGAKRGPKPKTAAIIETTLKTGLKRGRKPKLVKPETEQTGEDLK